MCTYRENPINVKKPLKQIMDAKEKQNSTYLTKRNKQITIDKKQLVPANLDPHKKKQINTIFKQMNNKL